MNEPNHKPSAISYKLTIGWLYPELMSTYGDRGNIIVLQKRCEWRRIDVEVKKLDIGFKANELETCDLLFMGGAQDKEQTIVAKDLKEKKDSLQSRIEEGIPGLYICGAYQFLGKYYKEADGTIIEGLGILDLYTENPGLNHPRLIGNVMAELNPNILRANDSESRSLDSSRLRSNNKTLVGFENHGGRTYLGEKVKPLATIVVGHGNNGRDKTEGAIYKNSFSTYFHGPILPKNPHLADHLIRLALEKKYQRPFNLGKLVDSMEIHAHNVIAEKIKREI